MTTATWLTQSPTAATWAEWRSHGLNIEARLRAIALALEQRISEAAALAEGAEVTLQAARRLYNASTPFGDWTPEAYRAWLHCPYAPTQITDTVGPARVAVATTSGSAQPWLRSLSATGVAAALTWNARVDTPYLRVDSPLGLGELVLHGWALVTRDRLACDIEGAHLPAGLGAVDTSTGVRPRWTPLSFVRLRVFNEDPKPVHTTLTAASYSFPYPGQKYYATTENDNGAAGVLEYCSATGYGWLIKSAVRHTQTVGAFKTPTVSLWSSGPTPSASPWSSHLALNNVRFSRNGLKIELPTSGTSIDSEKASIDAAGGGAAVKPLSGWAHVMQEAGPVGGAAIGVSMIALVTNVYHLTQAVVSMYILGASWTAATEGTGLAASFSWAGVGGLAASFAVAAVIAMVLAFLMKVIASYHVGDAFARAPSPVWRAWSAVACLKPASHHPIALRTPRSPQFAAIMDMWSSATDSSAIDGLYMLTQTWIALLAKSGITYNTSTKTVTMIPAYITAVEQVSAWYLTGASWLPQNGSLMSRSVLADYSLPEALSTTKAVKSSYDSRDVVSAVECATIAELPGTIWDVIN